MVEKAANEIVSILAKKWGVNMAGPIPEVTEIVQRTVDARLETYRAEFVPDLPTGLPANPVHGKFTQL